MAGADGGREVAQAPVADAVLRDLVDDASQQFGASVTH